MRAVRHLGRRHFGRRLPRRAGLRCLHRFVHREAWPRHYSSPLLLDWKWQELRHSLRAELLKRLPARILHFHFQAARLESWPLRRRQAGP